MYQGNSIISLYELLQSDMSEEEAIRIMDEEYDKQKEDEAKTKAEDIREDEREQFLSLMNSIKKGRVSL